VEEKINTFYFFENHAIYEIM